MQLADFYEYTLLFNIFSLTLITMIAATAFFWFNKDHVATTYKPVIVLAGVITLISAFHYHQIFELFTSAFTITNGNLEPTGRPFDPSYRYVEWLLTAPLCLIAFVHVLNLNKEETLHKSISLALASVIMVALAYPGEMTTNLDSRFFWWIASVLPFLYIVFEICFGLGPSIKSQPKKARALVQFTAWLIILSWAFYPVVYLLPNFGRVGGEVDVTLQISYAVTDIISKAGFGLLIYLVARAKS